MDTFLNRTDTRLAYSADGPARALHTLVVTHAMTASREYEDAWGVFDWAPVAESGERVVRFDTRGHGASTGRPDPGDYRWETLAGDLLAVADEVSPGRPVDGLGMSGGCGALLWAATRAPHRFRRLVLVIPPPAGDARTEQAGLYRAAADLVELRGLDAWTRAAANLPAVPALSAGGWTRSPVPAVSAENLPAILRGDADSDLPAEEALSALGHDTLVLAWRTDRSHPVAAAEQLAARLPYSTLEIADSPADIRGWGALVRDFLNP